MTVVLRCTFVPQYWEGDNALPATKDKPWHEYVWVTEYPHLPASGAYGRYDNDVLREAREAPDWVKDWQGPFEVEYELIGPLALLETEREKLWTRFTDAGGRGIGLADEIDRLDKMIARLQPNGELACPSCGATEQLGQVDTYLGTADGRYMRRAGIVEFIPSGSTEIHWDTAKRADEPVSCGSCGWEGQERQLVLHPVDEDEDDEGSGCEDCDVNGEGCLTHGTAIAAALDAARNQPEATLAALREAGLAPVETE